jgi:GxxExxY protein
MTKQILFKDLSDTIIGIAFKVHAKLGSYLPELVYERSMIIELNKQNIPAVHQQRYEVCYDTDEPVGHFYADIVVDNKIILELKSSDKITTNHFAQLYTYLRVSKIKLGYIINFGTRHMQFKRLIL